MDVIRIINSQEQIVQDSNFKFVEFWKPTVTPLCQDFDSYSCIITSLDAIRDHFNTPWEITSCWRPNDPIGGPDAHKICPPAIDSICCDRTKWSVVCEKIREELKNWQSSDLVKSILLSGTNVVLIEPYCLHLHYRTEYLNTTKEFGSIYLGEWSLPNNNIPYSFNT